MRDPVAAFVAQLDWYRRDAGFEPKVTDLWSITLTVEQWRHIEDRLFAPTKPRPLGPSVDGVWAFGAFAIAEFAVLAWAVIKQVRP